jgi:hypothetical protein
VAESCPRNSERVVITPTGPDWTLPVLSQLIRYMAGLWRRFLRFSLRYVACPYAVEQFRPESPVYHTKLYLQMAALNENVFSSAFVRKIASAGIGGVERVSNRAHHTNRMVIDIHRLSFIALA